ncbi:hypothetical protein [Neptuniibacter sp. QD34_54]|uniref:hypothetical protein n=1 Tax=Neptuniibacter sp. QD34_54 TaxID=3398208 RepID=UPI0039F4C778
MNKLRKAKIAMLFSTMFMASAVNAKDHMSNCEHNWISKNDKAFAKSCADMAFGDDLEARQKVAWMLFARVNQLIKDNHGVSNSDRVPQWMAWATDSDTFTYFPSFKYSKVNRADLDSVTPKKLLAGKVSMSEPNGANEEVTRNKISYDYLTKKAKLNTKLGVLQYIKAGNTVDMPVGTIELKASWLKVPPGGAPKGALTFEFASGTYWWRGIHIMAKMKPLPKGENLYYTEEPSWFWTTFELTTNPGVQHVRDTFITQNKPLGDEMIGSILKESGLAGFGLEAYSPNGTQIRYTEGGEGTTPVILGHTDMEDFAGFPNTAQPAYWSSYNSSCHTCHATAAINPETETYFPFTVPVGALNPQYYGADANGTNLYLGDGFVPLDFMWPISFHAK